LSYSLHQIILGFRQRKGCIRAMLKKSWTNEVPIFIDVNPQPLAVRRQFAVIYGDQQIALNRRSFSWIHQIECNQVAGCVRVPPFRALIGRDK